MRMIRNTIYIITGSLTTGGFIMVLGVAVLLSRLPAGEVAAASPEAVVHGRTMGTYYRVTAAGAAAGRLEALGPRIAAVLEDIEGHMSTYRPDSTLSRINASPGGVWLPAHGALVEVVALARGVSEASRGAFDVTAGPLVNLWGFGPEGRAPAEPAPALLAAARRLVSFRGLEAREAPPALRKDVDGMYVDLSGIAKGYAVDAVSRLLVDHGVRDYLVDIGGELRVAGLNGSGVPWSVAIENPGPDDERTVRHIIQPGDKAVATSGDYRNYVERDGRRYTHVIDPRDGRPVAHGLASATVVAETAALADAYATAVLVLGAAEGLALLERRGLHGVLLRRTPEGFEARFTADFHRFLAGDSSPIQ